MFEIKLTGLAEQDLEAIGAYYLREASVDVATRVLALVIAKSHATISTLELHPNASRDGRIAGTCELVIHRLPYIAVVKVDERAKVVYVLTILHTTRKFP
jgi:plasmid stabilization system protein ParE